MQRDAYFVLHVTMQSGFEFKIPARGFNLKSWLAFEERMQTEVIVEQTTQAVYEHLIYGDPTCPLDSPADTKSKTPKTATKSPRKSGPSTKKVGAKPSATKASAKTATKTTRKTTPSSTPKPKSSTGSRTRKTK